MDKARKICNILVSLIHKLMDGWGHQTDRDKFQSMASMAKLVFRDMLVVLEGQNIVVMAGGTQTYNFLIG